MSGHESWIWCPAPDSKHLQTMFLRSQAAGGIVSTARDLEKFMAALASGKLGRSLWRSFRAHVYFMNLFNFRYQNSTSQKNRKDKSKSQRFNVSLKRTSWLLVGTVFWVHIRGDLELGDVGSLHQGGSFSKILQAMCNRAGKQYGSGSYSPTAKTCWKRWPSSWLVGEGRPRLK